MKMNAKTRTSFKAIFGMFMFFSLLLPYVSCKQKRVVTPQVSNNGVQEVNLTLECDDQIKLKEKLVLKIAKSTLWKDVKPKITSQIVSVDEGWEIDEWLVGEKRGKSLTPTYKFEKDEKVFISAMPVEETPYTVEHWKETIDGKTFEVAEKEEKTGSPFQDTQASAKTYEGFDHREFSQEKINEDGSTVVRIYYDRLIVSLELNLNGGKTSTRLFDGKNGKKILKGKAGTPVVLQNPTRENAIFKGFSPQLPINFPNKEEEKVYEAQWEVLSSIIKITITGDERLDLEESILMETPREKGKTWGDVKNAVRGKVKLKSEWTGFWGAIKYYDVYQWRLEDEKGEVLRDEYELKKDITVFAVTNYIKFRIQDGVLQGYEDDGIKGKPRGPIVIPEEITKIDQFSLTYCSDITKVDFSQCTKLEKIEASAFFSCDKIESIDFSKCPDLKELDGFERCANLRSVNLSGCSKLKVLDGFVGCTALKEIDLKPCPNIEELGAQVFNECVSLQSIDLSPCPKIKKIGGLAFKRCMALKEIDLSCCPNIEEIQTCVFQECKNLKKINLSGLSKIKEIPIQTFKGCESLEELDLSSWTSLIEIGWDAFEGCSALKKIDMSKSYLKKIGSGAFEGCEALKELDISHCVNLNKLSQQTFAGCINAKVFLPNNINEIKEAAFGNHASNYCKNVVAKDENVRKKVLESGYPKEKILSK